MQFLIPVVCLALSWQHKLHEVSYILNKDTTDYFSCLHDLDLIHKLCCKLMHLCNLTSIHELWNFLLSLEIYLILHSLEYVFSLNNLHYQCADPSCSIYCRQKLPSDQTITSNFRYYQEFLCKQQIKLFKYEIT